MDRFVEMQTFTAVVDAGSFVRAAETLGLSKAAVSRNVDALERRLGVRLLHRTTRRLSLTDEGRLFYTRSRELLGSVEEAESEVAANTDAASGHLRINAPVTFGNRHLAPLWGPFLAQHPRITLDVTLSDRIVDLVEEGYDLAIRISPQATSSLVRKRLTTARLRVCASPQYLRRHGTPRTPADLASHAVIGYSYFSSRDEWRFEGPKGRSSVRTQPRVHSNSGETCRALALAHQGIVLQPDFLVGDDIRDGRLVELLRDQRCEDLVVYAVYPTRKHVPAKVRAVVDHLAAAFARR